MAPQISLEQWRSLINVVEAGGYAQAAQQLYKSQSAVSYAVQKIEAQLGVKLFAIQGRRAVLTPTGQTLYRRALTLINEANDLERAAQQLSAGWEATITLAAEILVPTERLLVGLHRFGIESPNTRIELIESILGGTSEALTSGQADLAIAPQLPQGFLGDLITRIRLQAVAHADHPLNQAQHSLSYRDLRSHRHIVVRDSGGKRDQCAVSVEVDQRWYVSQVATSIQAVCNGYGFAWLPEQHIREELRSGLLKPLPLKEGGMREVPLYLILAKPDLAGPGTLRLKNILKELFDAE
jgi:DNA-binding transcriptional LysR family regulator